MIHICGEALGHKVFINGHFLEIGPSQRLKFYSASFDWGTISDGTRQFSIALLLELTGDWTFAIDCCEDLEIEWVSKLPFGKDFLGWSKIDGWITERGGKIKNCYELPYTT